MSDSERALRNFDAGSPDAEEEEEITSEQAAQTEQIVQTGSITATKGKYPIHCLTIVGQVEGHYILPPQNKTTKYEHVIPQLVAIEENPEIEGLIIILNTVGGDVEAGLAIAELVSGMKKPTVSLVLGGGHSIGVPLAVSAKVSFIAPSATMTIHPVRMNGLVLGVPQTLSYFDKMQERIVRFVVDNSRIGNAAFRKLMMQTGELVMDVGTVLDGKEAVNCGLIDSLGGLHDAIAKLYELIEERKEDKKPKGKRRGKAAKGKETGAAAPEPAVASPRAIAQLAEAARKRKNEPLTVKKGGQPGRGRPRKNLLAAEKQLTTNSAEMSTARVIKPTRGRSRKNLPDGAQSALAADKGTTSYHGPVSAEKGAPASFHSRGTASYGGPVPAVNSTQTFPAAGATSTMIGPQGSWVSGPQSGWVSRGGMRFDTGAGRTPNGGGPARPHNAAAAPVLMDAAVPIHPAADRTAHQPPQSGHIIGHKTEGIKLSRLPGGNPPSAARPGLSSSADGTPPARPNGGKKSGKKGGRGGKSR